MSQMKTKWHPYPRYLLRKNAIISLLRKIDTRGMTALEFGYGSGDMLNEFGRMGMKVYGYDYSDDAKAIALEIVNNSQYSKNIHLLSSEKQITKRKYDIIFAFEVLEHVEDDYRILRKWKNLLKNDGRLIISVPAHLSDWNAADVFAGHFRRYERKNLISLLDDAGYEVDTFWNYGYPLTKVTDIMRNLVFKNRFKKVKLSVEGYTKVSGIKSKSTLITKLLYNNTVLKPFMIVQKLFFNTDLGNSYLVVAKVAKLKHRVINY